MDEVEINIQAKLTNQDQALAFAGDLAWEHSVFASDVLGVSMGSDDFVELFEEMRDSYSYAAEQLEFLTYTAMILVRSLLKAELITLNCDFPITDENLADYIGEVTEPIVASYAWLLASQDFIGEITNELLDNGSVKFTFPSDQIIIVNPNH